MDGIVRQELSQIYRDIDALVKQAGPVCQASGRCCRFREWGHTLFLTRIEAEYLLENAPQWDRPIDDSFCPYQVKNLCMAREQRPLGCRVYFCDPSFQERMPEIMELGISKLRALADRTAVGWDYAPLHRFLIEHQNSGAALAPDKPT